MTSKMKFVIFSNQEYDLPLKTNKWHVANVLARKGYEVIYIDPPLRFKNLKKYLKNPSINILRLFFSVDYKRDNLIVYSPTNIFNFYPFSLFNTWMHSLVLNKLLSRDAANKKSVLWIYHFDFPDLKNFIDKIAHRVLIYDVVDEYTAFPEYKYNKQVNKGLVGLIQSFDNKLKIMLNQKGLYGVNWVLHQEKWLANRADLIFASTENLVQKFRKFGYKPRYLPNAADAKKFDIKKSDVLEPNDIKDIKHPRIGFTGAIDDYKVNTELILKCALKYKNYQFVLIGPKKLSDPSLDVKKISALNNVHFLGTKQWEDTPKYFVYFDAFFIPYRINDYTVKGCFPVKYFESLAAGLPTVVTNLPAYKKFNPDGYVSKNGDEFIENLGKVMKDNNASRVKKRKKLAYENTWEQKVRKQIKLIIDVFNDS